MKNLLLILIGIFLFENLLSQGTKYILTDSRTIYYSASPDESTIIFEDIEGRSQFEEANISFMKLDEMVYRVFSSSEDLLTLEIPNCSVFPAYFDQNDRLMYLTDEIIVCFKQGISPLER